MTLTSPGTGLSPDTVIARGSSHVETEASGQIMMMSIEQGKYYALEGTAKAIWEHLIEPVMVSELISDLVETYDVSAEQCQADVTGFLKDMMANGLVVEHASSAGT